jgi:uncharacterized RDD family membrane protein YckC
VGWYVTVAGVGGLAFALGYGWPNWMLAYWLSLWLVGWLSNTLAATEWTIAGRELRRRRWFSWPGSKPSAVMPLGPEVEIVHVAWSRWRIWPGGYAIDVRPWQTSRLVGPMERADVRVDDWRGDWSRRHRLLNAFGVLGYVGGAIAIIVVIALGGLRPGSVVSFVAFVASISALLLGLTIDFLPWGMGKAAAQDVGWPQPPAGAPGGVWAQQTEVGPAPGLAFGGFWVRVVAYINDVILLGIVEVILIWALGAAWQWIGGLIWIVYFVGLWGTRGQTIGMALLGLRVVRNADGGKITWGNAVLRFIGLLVAFACIWIGVIWVAFDSRKRGWQDMIGGTVVVRRIG